MKKICFRFDIDSPRCLSEGVHNLLELAKKHDVFFTFFVHCGQSISRTRSLINLLNRIPTFYPQLSSYQKLGWRQYFYTAICNPFLINKYQDTIRLLVDNGHEVALHGGRNHQEWAECASFWNEVQVEKEISWGLSELQKLGIEPKGFSSPQWNDPPHLSKILKKLGFQYLSSSFDNNQKDVVSFPVSLIKNHGVAFFELQLASKKNEEDIFHIIDLEIEQNCLPVIYDHPCFVGTQQIGLLERLIVHLKQQKVKIVLLQDCLNSFSRNEKSVQMESERKNAGCDGRVLDYL